MKIHQHDGVVVDAAGSPQGFAKHKRGGEVLRRGREAQRGRGSRVSGSPKTPTIYRRGGGCAPSRVPSLGVEAAPRWHLVRPEGGEGGGAPRVGLRAHLP